MSGLRLGELCAGYGGLGMAVEEVFGATSAWFSEFDDAPSKILAHHWPDVPNYGDMTKIDWAAIEPVDIISGGTPCQDLSGAGRRAGMTEGTRSNLWVQMREAIAIQKPTYVVWENVRGAYSATAASDLEQCPGCMGDTGDGGTVLRALGRVLGDLSDLGYDTQWRGLRAADVGACHGRFRVFILAQNADVTARGERWLAAPGQAQGGRAWPHPSRRDRAFTPDSSGSRTWLHSGAGGQTWEQAGTRGAALVSPGNGSVAPEGSQSGHSEPLANSASARRSEGEDSGTGFCHACERPWGSELERAGGERIGATSNTLRRGRDGRTREAGREALGGAVAQWPGESIGIAPDNTSAAWRGTQSGDLGTTPASAAEPGELAGPIAWGEYEPAIRRWESRLGRPAPRPTEPTGRNNGQRLSPRFTEWMMGLPDGWVTDPAIGLTRNEQLKACGNGVVPQQAMAALRDMLGAFQLAEVAA